MRGAEELVVGRVRLVGVCIEGNLWLCIECFMPCRFLVSEECGAGNLSAARRG